MPIHSLARGAPAHRSFSRSSSPSLNSVQKKAAGPDEGRLQDSPTTVEILPRQIVRRKFAPTTSGLLDGAAYDHLRKLVNHAAPQGRVVFSNALDAKGGVR